MNKLLNPDTLRERINKLGGPFIPVEGMTSQDVLATKSYLAGEILGLFNLEDLPVAIPLFNQMAGFQVTLRPEGEKGPLLRF
ncbi:MAG: hypothetical protein WAV40_04050 [Microgenomates group bacterium]